ncbi:MAG: T9SS type A sorting domain-containing protein [Bacteroidetes bacterium]|nr:T9SS type A sorting domain-containing protein [Bacteroidota bacterium]
MKWEIVISIFLILGSSIIQAQQLAFPSAEGAGRFATGGRGGAVYEVTNLNNSGPGSIVDAVSQPNRTIVFRVSGTIELGNVILKPKSNITIAGQTAPGDGICIKGRIQIDASNVIIRYIRVRVDAGAANSSGDAIDISSGSNIIIDHVSASYARDEGISCQERTNNVTVQWCMITEALTFESHSYGSLIRGDYGDLKTYHHNLYAHNNNRLPRPGNYTNYPTDTLGLFFDFRNNVVYNWKGSYPGYNADTGSISNYNFVGNVYVPGLESSITGIIFKEDAYRSTGYFADNMYNGSIPPNQWSMVQFGSKFTAERIQAYKARSREILMPPVRTTSPQIAYQEVLASAGASFPKRDPIDTRIVYDVQNKTGRSIATTAEQPEGGWPVLQSLPAPQDDDHDGMPNEWERAFGLNPNDPSDRNVYSPAGYTMLEEYLNSLVGESTITDVAFTQTPNIPLEVRLFQNFPNPFNPVTVIQFQLQMASVVSVKVYSVQGKEIQTLTHGVYPTGLHSVVFDGSNLPSGVYVYRLHTATQTLSKTMVLLK